LDGTSESSSTSRSTTSSIDGTNDSLDQIGVELHAMSDSSSQIIDLVVLTEQNNAVDSKLISSSATEKTKSHLQLGAAPKRSEATFHIYEPF